MKYTQFNHTNVIVHTIFGETITGYVEHINATHLVISTPKQRKIFCSKINAIEVQDG